MRKLYVVVCAVFMASIWAAASGRALEAGGQQPLPRPVSPTGPVRDAPGGRGVAPVHGTAVIDGTVTLAASGQPAGGARVMVNGQPLPGGRSGITDNQGRFAIGSLPAGRYFVSVSKPGYVNTTYGQRRSRGPGTGIQLADGQTRTLSLQLSRGGVITGMVLDERGDPSINTFVRALRFAMVNGQRRPQQQSAGATTDDRGIYRLHSLEPGDYVVCATARGSMNLTDAQRIQNDIEGMRRAVESGNSPSAAARQSMVTRIAQLQAQLPTEVEPAAGYAPVCYPGTGTPGTGAIPIAAGDERTGMDLQLQLIPVARVEGSVTGVPTTSGSSTPNVQIMLINLDEAMASMDTQGARIENGDRFTFTNIPPGNYRIVARTSPTGPMAFGPMGPGSAPRARVGPQPTEPKLWAVADIVVASQDITNVMLEMQRGMTISGHLIFQGSTGEPAPQDLSRLEVNVFPISTGLPSLQLATNAQGKLDVNGRFTISDVMPGRYRLTASAGVSGWILDSVTVSGQDALDRPLDVRPAQHITDAVLLFTDRPTELSGTIVNERGEPAPDQTILLYPADEKLWTPDSRRIRVARTDQDGKYIFRTLSPGDYRLATFLDAEPGAWQDPAFLEALGPTSTRVSLEHGEKKVQNLRVSATQ